MMMIILFMILLNLNIIFNSSYMIIMIMFNMLMMLSLLILLMNSSSLDWMMIYNFLGLDYISFSLLILSIWIISFMFMSSMNVKFNKLFSFLLLQLLLILMFSFMTMNYFIFYLFFEVSLIPTFLLIMGWGYQPERIKASMYMLLYTMFSSLPLLILMYYLFSMFNSMNYLIILNFINLKIFINDLIFYLFMIMAFMMKLPLFMFHMWLPKAHIEAPVSGSMILAGVMLKLGGYGIMRSLLMMLNLSIKFNYLFMIISLFGILLLSLVCLRQYDMKLIVAYSSVVHMGMMLMGLMSMMLWGVNGGLLMMIGHGICSPALFVLVNFIYERSKTRNMIFNKGMIYFLPSLSMWWFLFCIINMSAPISLNLMSELMIINILLNWSFNILLILMFGMFMSAVYSLFLFSYIQHGKFSMNLFKLFPMSVIDYLLMLLHWIPLNFIILKLDYLI
uniref:NADH-ubiquinone oxidoreductase chain 4 n=1 Tax=Torymus sp. ZJUH_2016035 TaxID=2491172 RepID=A0A3Q8UAF2_9HYME|nr:NADH dehydrogenase subunit 4 [Torymus sp. ZJUH_2016035]